MYNVLLADDELPAIRFLETIISKYTSDFSVIKSFRDGAGALEWLKEKPDSVDVLITDIRMPDMDGITLSKAARKLRPDLHIVIVSGYSEFEYAHGAIEAAVDDYILKPVSVSHMKELLNKIKNALDHSREGRLPEELSSMLKQRTFDRQFINEQFSFSGYYFALLRFGNVLYPQKELTETVFTDNYRKYCDLPAESDSMDRCLYRALSGKDDKEFIFFSEASSPISSFQNAIRQLSDNCVFPTVTTVFAISALSFDSMGIFYNQASRLIRHEAVIGQHREILYTLDSNNSSPSGTVITGTGSASNRSSNVPNTILRQLELAVSDNNRKVIHDLFISLGNSWDKAGISQRQAYVMMQQLLHLVEAVRREHWKTTDQILQDADALTNTVTSYTELTVSLYELLYPGNTAVSDQMSPEEMYRYAVRAIEGKFDQPINIQTVCSEIGISQTYLSRLFRKYGNTSFNTFLVKCRMDNAKRIMREQPLLPLHQIAACVGYEDYAYFSKVFRQISGCSPSQYQAQISDNCTPVH